MNLLDKRKDNSDAILKGIFIRRELQEESQEIDVAQTSLMARRGFKSSEFYSSRNYSVNETTLRYDHLAKHRFVDMKRRNVQGNSIKKKSHPIHNRILWGHANNIVKRLSFGYTSAVKEEMRQLAENLTKNRTT